MGPTEAPYDTRGAPLGGPGFADRPPPHAFSSPLRPISSNEILKEQTARYGTPDPDWGMDDVADESRAKLFRSFAEGDRLNYTYDFGDNWVPPH